MTAGGIAPAGPVRGPLGGWGTPIAVCLVVVVMLGTASYLGGAGPRSWAPAPDDGRSLTVAEECFAPVRNSLTAGDPVMEDEAGGVEVWSDGIHTEVCAAQPEGILLMAAHAVDEPVDPVSLAVVGVAPATGSGTRYVGGGPVPPGVTRILFDFPDGHVVVARIRPGASVGRWWTVSYLPTARLAVIDDGGSLVADVVRRDGHADRVTVPVG